MATSSPMERDKLRVSGKLYAVSATFWVISPMDVFSFAWSAISPFASTSQPTFSLTPKHSFSPLAPVDKRRATFKFSPTPNELSLEEVGQFHDFVIKWAQAFKLLAPAFQIEVSIETSSGTATF